MTFSLKLQGYDERSAELSDDSRYRYTLTRAWAPGGRRALVVGHNPSTADAEQDDQTIRRLRQLLGDAGFAGFTIVNLFAFRATDPKDCLAMGGHAIGYLRQEETLTREVRAASCVIAAWGEIKTERQEERVNELLIRLAPTGKSLFCFGLTKGGFPRHPSRLPRSAKLEVCAP